MTPMYQEYTRHKAWQQHINGRQMFQLRENGETEVNGTHSGVVMKCFLMLVFLSWIFSASENDNEGSQSKRTQIKGISCSWSALAMLAGFNSLKKMFTYMWRSSGIHQYKSCLMHDLNDWSEMQIFNLIAYKLHYHIMLKPLSGVNSRKYRINTLIMSLQRLLIGLSSRCDNTRNCVMFTLMVPREYHFQLKDNCNESTIIKG